ncbi:MAG TPA: reverse transcriptase domain-containing protein [Pirellulales bacterium]|nr:reverse transcriptase domain-containing protein [Pirellulales bacterium]
MIGINSDGGPPRRYRFAEARADIAYEQRRARRLLRERMPPSEVTNPILSFQQIVSPENLLRVFREMRVTSGPAPGVDGLTYDDFTITEVAAILRAVSLAILAHQYKPYPTRLCRIPKDAHRYRELRLRTIIDRVAAAALAQALSALWNRYFLPGSFGFRPGCNTWHFLAAVDGAVARQGRQVLAQDDVQNAFPSAPIVAVMDAVRHFTEDENILWLIDTIARGDEGAAHTVGLDQGCPLSPVLMNVLLHIVLDRPFTADSDNPLWYRYVDNLCYLCSSVSEGHRAIRRATELLSPAGLQLKGQDGPPIDLRRQGAHVKILGFTLSLKDDRIQLGTTSKAWQHLRQSLMEAHEAPNPARTATQVAQGWLEAQGPALESASVTGILTRMLSMAALTGFREIGHQAWEQIAQNAHQRWLAVRNASVSISDGSREGTAGRSAPVLTHH